MLRGRLCARGSGFYETPHIGRLAAWLVESGAQLPVAR